MNKEKCDFTVSVRDRFFYVKISSSRKRKTFRNTRYFDHDTRNATFKNFLRSFSSSRNRLTSNLVVKNFSIHLTCVCEIHLVERLARLDHRPSFRVVRDTACRTIQFTKSPVVYILATTRKVTKSTRIN